MSLQTETGQRSYRAGGKGGLPLKVRITVLAADSRPTCRQEVFGRGFSQAHGSMKALHETVRVNDHKETGVQYDHDKHCQKCCLSHPKMQMGAAEACMYNVPIIRCESDEFAATQPAAVHDLIMLLKGSNPRHPSDTYIRMAYQQDTRSRQQHDCM